ncbi:MAG: TIGR04255 family protein [Gaiella sp.]
MFNLERPPRYRLARPPLVEALVDVRYPVRAGLQSVEGIAPLQSRLEQMFPYMTQAQVQQIQLQIGPGSPPVGAASGGNIWQFNDDAGWVLVIAPDRATLAVGPQYANFTEFLDRFRVVVQALGEAGGVNRCDRLGVRYLDVALIPPGQGDGWRTWFRPELTGWPATDVVNDAATIFTSLMQTQLSVPATGELAGPPADITAIIRHGLVPQNSVAPTLSPGQPLAGPAFLLDTDLFVAAQQPFDPDRLVDQVTIFHDQLDRFFHWSLTPDGEEYFGLEVVE